MLHNIIAGAEFGFGFISTVCLFVKVSDWLGRIKITWGDK